MSTASRAPDSFRQKLGLVAFGLFLTMLVLEGSLRLGGCIILGRQAHRNALAMRQKGVYRIMCIGESTTQGQYPAFLEQALNGRDLGTRFSVIDRGLGGTSTSELLERLETDLDSYHPDMVVAMMGINERGPYMPYGPETRSRTVRLIRTLKIYKLARISWMHIVGAGNRVKPARHDAAAAGKPASKTKTQSAFAQDKTNQAVNSEGDVTFMELGRVYREQGRFADAEEALKKSLAINPRNDRAYVYLGLTYLSQGRTVPRESLQARGKSAEATVAFKRALEINPRNDDAYRGMGIAAAAQDKFAAAAFIKKAVKINPGSDANHMELGRIYRDMGMTGAAAAAFKKAVEIGPKNDEAFGEWAQLYLSLPGSRAPQKGLLVKPILQELVREYAVLNMNPTDRACAWLSLLYAAMGDTWLAKQYHDQAEGLRLREYDPRVADNYHRLKSVLDRRGVKLVCVQYPMCRLESLRAIFQGQDEGIVFVDNEKVFQDAVSKGSLAEYFRDMFAGDFGHCTDKGNHLLADNIAATLAREVFGK